MGEDGVLICGRPGRPVKSVVPSRRRTGRLGTRNGVSLCLVSMCGLQWRRDLRDSFTLMLGDFKLIGGWRCFCPEPEDDP